MASRLSGQQDPPGCLTTSGLDTFRPFTRRPRPEARSSDRALGLARGRPIPEIVHSEAGVCALRRFGHAERRGPGLPMPEAVQHEQHGPEQHLHECELSASARFESLSSRRAIARCFHRFYRFQILNQNPEVFPYYDPESKSAARGLTNFVHWCFGLPLDKIEQRSNWERRPLRKTQVEYAGDLQMLTSFRKPFFL